MNTTITFNRDKKGNVESVAIHNTMFLYTNIKNPRPIFNDRELPYDQARKEYSVEVVVSEEIADEWDEIFVKQPSKKYTNAKFREKYKMDEEDALPFPDEKKQYTIKLTQKAQKNDGDPINSSLIPRVFLVKEVKNGDKVENEATDITFSTNVGNGSKGSVLTRANTNGFGAFAYLSKLRIKEDDLIEYESSGSGGISDEDKDFLGVGEIELADAPERKATKATERTDDDTDDDDDDKPAAKPAKKSASKSAKVETDVDEDDF